MKLLILATLLLFCSCESKKSNKDFSNIDAYLKQYNFKRENQLLVFLTTDSCSGCSNETINVLNKVAKYDMITIIIIGDSKKETLNLAQYLDTNYTVLYDFKGNGFELIESNSNMLVKIKSEKIKSNLNFTVENIRIAINQIILYEN